MMREIEGIMFGDGEYLDVIAQGNNWVCSVDDDAAVLIPYSGPES